MHCTVRKGLKRTVFQLPFICCYTIPEQSWVHVGMLVCKFQKSKRGGVRRLYSSDRKNIRCHFVGPIPDQKEENKMRKWEAHSVMQVAFREENSDSELANFIFNQQLVIPSGSTQCHFPLQCVLHNTHKHKAHSDKYQSTGPVNLWKELGNWIIFQTLCLFKSRLKFFYIFNYFSYFLLSYFSSKYLKIKKFCIWHF